MKSQFSKTWKSSKKPAKQVKYRANAPLHIKRKMLGAHLSKDLREKHNKRSMPVKKGDKVSVMRGTHKGKEGSIESVDTRRSTVNISGIDLVKKNGSKAFYPIKISNLLIKELNLSDKKRKNILERKKRGEAKETAPSKEKQEKKQDDKVTDTGKTSKKEN